MAYYINPLQKNHINKNKYHAIKAMEGVIDIRSDYWYTSFYLYSYNNFSLPLDSLLATYKIPYQSIEDVSFNLAIDQEMHKKYGWPDYYDCKIYEATNTINIANNEYLKTLLNNVQIQWLINFEIDPTPLSKVTHNIPQEALDDLINETSKLDYSFEMYYSNNCRFNINHPSCNITNQYQLDVNGQIHENKNAISAIVNDYSDATQPIILLASFKSNKKFQISNIKIKFVYEIDGEDSPEKSFEIVSYATNENMYQTDINFDAKTFYDHINKKIINSMYGIVGFYIPKYATGYYQISFNVFQDFNSINCVLTNPFHFNIDNDLPRVNVKPITIDNLEGYIFRQF